MTHTPKPKDAKDWPVVEQVRGWVLEVTCPNGTSYLARPNDLKRGEDERMYATKAGAKDDARHYAKPRIRRAIASLRVEP